MATKNRIGITCIYILLMILLLNYAYSIPFVTRVAFSPTDINSYNLFNKHMNVTYSIIPEPGRTIINNSIMLNYKINSTITQCFEYILGVKFCDWKNITYNNATGNKYSFRLYDNNIYPGTYNIKYRAMDTISHSYTSLTANGYLLKMRLYNVTGYNGYNILEVYANSTSGISPLNIYYCNSSYTNGNVLTSPYCVFFYSLAANSPYNHSHSHLSYHYAIPFATNDGFINSLRVTSNSYFIFKGTTGTTWRLYYIANNTGTMQTSINTGVTYSALSGTLDSHLHQYYNNDYFNYYVCARNDLNQVNCSITSHDLLQLGGLPPNSPHVIYPVSNIYSGNINITYDYVLSPNAYAIEYYNISLFNSLGYVMTISPNNYPNFYDVFDTTLVLNGDYYISVRACDIFNQCSSGFSEDFTIHNDPVLIGLGGYNGAYISIVLIFIAVISFLLFIGEKSNILIDFFTIESQKENEYGEVELNVHQIHMIRFIMYLIAGWIAWILITVATNIAELEVLTALYVPIDIIYSIIFWLLLFFTSAWIIGLLIFIIRRIRKWVNI